MEQDPLRNEKQIAQQNSEFGGSENQTTPPDERASSSNTEQKLPVPDPINKENEKTAAKEAPPIPPKDPSDSVPIDWTQLGDFTYYRATPNRTAPAAAEELPPDFLEPTAEDLKSAQASLVARSRAYQEAPLLTESLRKKKEEEIRSKWPTTTIRIKFADMSMLEKRFPSTSVIKPIYAFVRSCLREDAKPHKFVLYEPPRRELKVSDPNVRDKSLYDLHLAPRSVLYFRFLEDNVKLDLSAGPPPIYSEILSRGVDLPSPLSESANSPSSSASEPKGSKPQSKGSKPLDTSDKDKKIARLLKFTKGRK